MIKGQKSIRNGIEDLLCPFEDMYISQGSNGAYSHKGIMANDVRGKVAGIKYPYYAPCTCKCIKIYPESGQSMWQSVNKVRFANGDIDYATFMIAHDNLQDCKIGQIVNQGNQLGNMGNKGNAKGVHCHIQTSKGKDTSWYKNKYDIYQFNNEIDLDDFYFIDNTNIIKGMGGNWKNIVSVKVEQQSQNYSGNQVISVGDKVKFDGIFKVDVCLNPKKGNYFGCCELTGCTEDNYMKEKVQSYHWIPSNDWTEVDKTGHHDDKQDQVLQDGISWVLNKNIYTVNEIDKNHNSIKLNLNGHDIWVFSTYLYKISN